jgi:hypothetical protein
MKYIRECFGETGDISMMRVMCFMSLCAAIVLAFTGHDNSVILFVSAAFGGKCVQKHLELSNGASETDTDSKN